jgi:predicted RNA-binding Zn ribbon-like protein
VSITLEPMQPAALVELVNEWGTVPRDVAGEAGRPFPGRYPAGLGVPDENVDEQAMRRAADLLHPVFTTTDQADRVARIAGMLADTRVRPAIVATAEGLVAAWTVDAPGHGLVAAAALALRDHLDRYGGDRLGVCTGRACADVFVDASPTRDRRYCSVTCQNRARVAAYRRRRRATT